MVDCRIGLSSVGEGSLYHTLYPLGVRPLYLKRKDDPVLGLVYFATIEGQIDTNYKYYLERLITLGQHSIADMEIVAGTACTPAEPYDSM